MGPATLDCQSETFRSRVPNLGMRHATRYIFPMNIPESNRTNLAGLGAVALGCALAWIWLGFPAPGIDDADIFFVYARNVAAGHGFVYNVGGEAVEGFTSLLWTLVCSGLRASEPLLLVVNVLLGGFAVGACLRRVERPGLFLVLLAAAPAWFAWCQLTLMETGLWCLLITLLGLAVAEGRRMAALVLLPLLVVTRPESMLWGAWALLLLFARAGKGERLRMVLFPAAAFGLALAGLVGFRLWYFGYPVPNTYYAKVSPGLFSNLWNGLVYLRNYLVGSPAVALLAATAAYALFRRRPAGRGLSFWLVLYLLPGIAIPVLVGGDHFGAFRFYQPLWPLLCLVAALEWPAPIQAVRPGLVKIFLILVLVSGWVLFPLTANLKHEFLIAREGRANGTALVRMFGDLDAWPTVATITAGGNKLTYPGHVHDLMGLNSTLMAHAPGERAAYKNHTGFNRGVFYRWQPDILLCGDSAEFDALVLNGLHDDPRFRALYVKCTLHRNGAQLGAWYRNDFLMALPGTGRPVAPPEE
ncbi:hypothetical protein PDESU_02770 [Pontiella desulfatans]|uniref:Glycosyltransferase RgtA/B/C/D-like domain-containing protein n=1 Tax=Pontiella desulfatans TaxID=2750659 RepID=A0A6C2U3T9_PONDE|nr:hypothetical protein [Pontiella desulfatans]VGO14211.1 hypothetical protein PDESU_02770 [Pontiella desulfatans]